MQATRVVLVGYMGAGKSTVGRLLAERLDWDFVDTDALVVQLSGRSIPELFAEGEAHFRRWEREAIATLAGRERLVVAAGGGAVTEAETCRLLSELGPVVWLDAPVEALWVRAGQDHNRPLSHDARAFKARWESRRPHYAQFPLRVNTAAAGPAESAARVAALLEGPQPLRVALGDRAYGIHIGPRALPSLPALLGEPGRCLLVTDENVAALYAEGIKASLLEAGWQPHMVVVPAGEGSKSMQEAGRLYDACMEAGLKRHHPVIALGGGVVGDLAGFVAATYQRGVPFVQVPTTLLAQIDSSVGGKVAINHPAGKNMIGAFYQPRLVLADLTTLLTLSDREYRAGMAELVKYGVILDAALFEQVETEIERVRARDLTLLEGLVRRSCELKAHVVQQDEREAPGGLRAILNFGHTVGHAIEAVAGYGEFLHGEAVAIGMVAAGELAVRKGLWKAEELKRLERLLKALDLSTEVPALDREALLAAMGRDKKNRDRGITFVLPKRLGEVVQVAVSSQEVAPLLVGGQKTS